MSMNYGAVPMGYGYAPQVARPQYSFQSMQLDQANNDNFAQFTNRNYDVNQINGYQGRLTTTTGGNWNSVGGQFIVGDNQGTGNNNWNMSNAAWQLASSMGGNVNLSQANGFGAFTNFQNTNGRILSNNNVQTVNRLNNFNGDVMVNGGYQASNFLTGGNYTLGVNGTPYSSVISDRANGQVNINAGYASQFFQNGGNVNGSINAAFGEYLNNGGSANMNFNSSSAFTGRNQGGGDMTAYINSPFAHFSNGAGSTARVNSQGFQNVFDNAGHGTFNLQGSYANYLTAQNGSYTNGTMVGPNNTAVFAAGANGTLSQIGRGGTNYFSDC